MAIEAIRKINPEPGCGVGDSQPRVGPDGSLFRFDGDGRTWKSVVFGDSGQFCIDTKAFAEQRAASRGKLENIRGRESVR